MSASTSCTGCSVGWDALVAGPPSRHCYTLHTDSSRNWVVACWAGRRCGLSQLACPPTSSIRQVGS
eukprot:3580458-Alexandrium_andersonii.AAC.1